MASGWQFPTVVAIPAREESGYVVIRSDFLIEAKQISWTSVSNVEEKYHTGQRKHMYSNRLLGAATWLPLLQGIFSFAHLLLCAEISSPLVADQGGKGTLTFSPLWPSSIWDTLILIILVLWKY